VRVVYWDIDDLNCTIPYFEPDLTAAENIPAHP